jgi:hypothetical protein
MLYIKYLRICFTVFIVLLFMALSAQTPLQIQQPIGLRCGTLAPTAEQIRYTLEVVAKQTIPRNAGMTCVPLQAHIVRDNAGAGGLTYETLNKGLANLNYVYKTAGIEFYWSGLPDYANNSDYYDYNDNATDADTEAGIRALFTVANNAINIYYVDKIITNNFEASGYAYFPGNNPIYNFILMDKDYQANAVNGTFAHEFGHFFNLYHTHEGTEFGNANANAENVPRSGTNSNCSAKGDLLCDTHADPKGTTANCVYTGGGVNIVDINGVAYTPPINNIMSYYPNNCGVNYFTPNQYTRIAQALVTRQGFTTYTMTAPAMNVTNPSGLTATQSALSAVLNWTDNASNEMGYLIERSTTSNSSGFQAITFGGTDANITTFTDANVSVGTTYYYRVKASNDNCNDYSNVISITPTAAYCTPSYTTTCFADASGVPRYIGTVTLKTTANATVFQKANSGCTGALSDFTAVSGNVTAGTGYNIKVDAATFSSSCYNQKVGIWLDANNDKDFDDVNEYLGNGTQSSCTVTIAITIPASTYNGARRLRVRSINTSETMASTTVCGSFSTGETEDYTLNVTGGTVLPLELLSFKAQAVGNAAAVINWETADENNVDHFLLEVSNDGKSYTSLTEMKPNGNGGGSYQFNHDSPKKTINYYRLSEVDLAGNTTVLAQGTVELRDKSQFAVIPNPTKNHFSIEFNGESNEPIKIQLIDALGRIIATPQYKAVNGLNSAIIDFPNNTADGIYFVQLWQNGYLRTAKIKKEH